MVIKLTPKAEEIGDVVVTGMAPRKVESFSGSYVTVKGAELKKLNPTNITSVTTKLASLMSGTVP